MMSQKRLQMLQNHVCANLTASITPSPQNSKILISAQIIKDGAKEYPEIIDYHPEKKIKLDYINKQGWGYKDTEFLMDTKTGMGKLTGSHYDIAGKDLPNLKGWAEANAGFDFSKVSPKQADMEIAPPIFNHAFLEELGDKLFDRRSFMKWERIMHSHGATLAEVFTLRHGKFAKIIDVVVYPDNQEQVEKIVALANKHDVVIVPYGGGTNVTQALLLNPKETRMIVSLDMARMNRIKWVDKINMLASIEAGIIGQDLERELKNYGVVLGHEPDSIEFSTLGGWVSTRASGMKKNAYGNIEDIVVNVKLVTSKGVITKNAEWPRVSNGPDLNHIVIGHEGNFGVVTEVIMRVRPIPEIKEFSSILFHDFEIGIKFMDEVARSRNWPASLRVVDNTQFKASQAMKEKSTSMTKDVIDMLKMFYVLKIKGYDIDKFVGCTVVFEGTKQEVESQKANLYRIAAKHNGLVAGSENGLKGYFLTFAIAYVRDFAAQYSYIAESFETSCPWSKVSSLCAKVRERLIKACADRGIKKERLFVSFRVTQIYETGAAVYVYFGYNYGHSNIPKNKVVHVYEEIENECRDEVLKQGGSLSHHHGIGKVRKRFMKDILPSPALEFMQEIKKSLDPKNVFAINNTIYRLENEEKEDLEGTNHH